MRTQSICLALAVGLLCPFASAQWAPTSLDSGLVSSFAINGKNLFAGVITLITGGGIFRSTNSGTDWTTTGLTNTSTFALAARDSTLFAATWFGIYCSTNNGTSWTAVNYGLTSTPVLSMAVSGTNLFAGTMDGVYRSTNNGQSWRLIGVDDSLPGNVIHALAVSGTNIVAGVWFYTIHGAVQEGLGVFVSSDSGITWIAADSGLKCSDVVSDRKSVV
jgi:ligand-binding sensor domain-containing protein